MKRYLTTYLPLLIFIQFSCNTKPKAPATTVSADAPEMLVSPAGKDSMLLLTDRPPNLETPLKYFLEDYTPNNVFFVRWHLSSLPSKVDIDTFRLRVNGNVATPLELSMEDLKTKFKPYTITALCQCAGNSRSFFDPRVAGGQWKNGAMGNAKWTGVKLKDILELAGAKANSKDVSFNGLDGPPMDSTPDFVKALHYDHAIDGEVMIAYEMNGEPLPLLNGYPLKLVVPGWYATYWVGMLSEVQVLDKPFKGFWMEKAYLVPKGVVNGNEKPDSLSKDMEPINKMDVRSLFVSPEPENTIEVGKATDIQGLAFDGGDGIEKVEISQDSGKTWKPARLDADLGKYSWRRWHYNFTPAEKGNYVFWVKATNSKGLSQPFHQWNRSGYMRNEIESLAINAQ
ncbi:molybdopterin-dependent oxidoreductase [Parafilimonas terrae]|jgi:DMSO/TMAO reductase YedYZ molybdopterin-dependent catalytic subunit|uniref:Sulfite dehydrogenase (Cytochrome) subunit SorA apoprotein n=1 Tax=Parafilimonas terrae TaxID=1465490 RepID=A0A1I5XMS4_9BACT|nr:molybdopterin-dependent oxidoreductase [Parafilimonas terrae]SFQ33234.1 sulfite dehydrogenase (cytochrome) subunit SorA apoprotein [Parafilimonas terrae]